MTGDLTDPPDPPDRSSGTVAEHWEALVATAMLGTDRRDPPPPPDPVADLVDDALRPTPSERMLAQVAATVAVRRAGVMPAPPRRRLSEPPDDDRPVCVPAAVDRWHHVVASWPVLEDEWVLTVLAHGWRVAPELVPPLLVRHRSDPIRRARAELACGPLGEWLAGHVPALAPRGPHARPADLAAALEHVGELPQLPIPSDLQPMLTAPGSDTGPTLAQAIDAGGLARAHRGVLVNLIARCRPDALAAIGSALDAVPADSPGYALASVLADLATTRRRMLDELGRA